MCWKSNKTKRVFACVCMCAFARLQVALKMAFRKFLADRGELGLDSPGSTSPDSTGSSSTSTTSTSSSSGSSSGGELLVLGLAGAYHGDTLGAQDCVAPSVFNGRLQAPWYRGRGLFLEPPYVGMSQVGEAGRGGGEEEEG